MLNISPSYITLVVVILITIANLFNVKLDEQALTVLVGEIITVAGSVYILYRKVKNGEINIFGKYLKK